VLKSRTLSRTAKVKPAEARPVKTPAIHDPATGELRVESNARARLWWDAETKWPQSVPWNEHYQILWRQGVITKNGAAFNPEPTEEPKEAPKASGKGKA